jgi:phosphatidylglycerol:prolipoprotein diacylglycerol transferase
MRQRLIESLPAFLRADWIIPDPSFVWVCALLAGLYYAVRYVKSAGLDQSEMYRICVAALVGGLWGSHLLNLAIYEPSSDPLVWLGFWEGGKVYYGGMLGGALTGYLFLKARRLPVPPHADAVVPAVFLGYAIGRVGCFLNGDDYGTLSSLPWAVRFPQGTEAYLCHLERGWIQAGTVLTLPIHPAQLYHAAAGLILFMIFRKWKGGVPGNRFAMAVVSYGVIRFCLQFFRGDYRAVAWSLDISQIISLLMVLAGCLLIYRLKKQALNRKQIFSLQGEAIVEK